MRLLGGVLSGAISCLLAYVFSTALAQGLPGDRQGLLAGTVTALGAIMGFMVGGAIAGRARRSADRLVTFAVIATAFGGGIVAGVGTIVVLALYLYTYAAWPSGLVDRVLYLLAFPSLGAFGFFVGAACWSVVGLVTGSALRLARLSSR